MERAGEPRGVAGGDAPRGSAGRWVLTACRRDLRPAGADLDALGLGLLGLGDQDLEHAVLEALGASMKILTAKAPAEAEAFPAAMIAICEEVATADGQVADAENEMIAKVRAALAV